MHLQTLFSQIMTFYVFEILKFADLKFLWNEYLDTIL